MCREEKIVIPVISHVQDIKKYKYERLRSHCFVFIRVYQKQVTYQARFTARSVCFTTKKKPQTPLVCFLCASGALLSNVGVQRSIQREFQPLVVLI